MSEDTGSKDRATVALVGAKVDEVKAIIEGHVRWTQQAVETLQQRQDVLEETPATVAKMHESLVLLQARVVILERAEADGEERRTQARIRDREWRRGPLLAAKIALVASGLACCATVISALISAHVFS